MGTLRRWGFFILTNILIVATLSFVLSVLGVGSYMTRSGIDYSSLLIFCAVWGMGGAFISLLLSRFMAKKMTGVVVVDPKAPGQYGWLVEMIHDLSRRARLPALPEVGVYPSADVNAFATGPSKSRSLVAVSDGLLRSMNKSEIEGVLAHEVAHIQNGDMVSMTLIQGVVNAFSMFLSRVLAFAISTAGGGNRDEERQPSPLLNGILVMVFDILFTALGSMAVFYFSRQREFRADKGSAKLSGSKDKMVGALRALQRLHHAVPLEDERTALATLKIAGGERKGFTRFFMSHPPLEERIAALERAI